MTSKIHSGRKIALWLTLAVVLCLAAYRIAFHIPSPIINQQEADRIANIR